MKFLRELHLKRCREDVNWITDHLEVLEFIQNSSDQMKLKKFSCYCKNLFWSDTFNGLISILRFELNHNPFTTNYMYVRNFDVFVTTHLENVHSKVWIRLSSSEFCWNHSELIQNFCMSSFWRKFGFEYVQFMLLSKPYIQRFRLCYLDVNIVGFIQNSSESNKM